MEGSAGMLLHLNFNSEVPIYQQIRNQVVIGIVEGKLKPGMRLPTVRELADESGINVMTVSKAYQLLKQEGYLQTERRLGSVISVPDKTEPDKQLLEKLRICLSELVLTGMEKEEILNLCRNTLQMEGRDEV